MCIYVCTYVCIYVHTYVCVYIYLLLKLEEKKLPIKILSLNCWCHVNIEEVCLQVCSEFLKFHDEKLNILF